MNLFFEVALAAYALFLLLWPKKALYAFYRSRNLSSNSVMVGIYRLIAGLAFAGLLYDVVLQIVRRGR
jgi:hypothetical protein